MGKIALIAEDDQNCREWKRGKVVHLIKDKDRVIRGVTLLCISAMCPLEIRAVENIDQPQRGRGD